MLVIRMQRTGRKGHAMFRVVVQDSRRTPTSGKVVTALGSYDPHNKTITLDKEKVSFYLEHGAQPSERVTRLLTTEKVKLPDWVAASTKKEHAVRNADKRRSTRPPAPKEEATAPAETEAVSSVPAEAVSVKPSKVEPAEAVASETTEPELEAPEQPPAEAVLSTEDTELTKS